MDKLKYFIAVALLAVLAGIVIHAAVIPPLYGVNAKYLGLGTAGGTANAQTITYSPVTVAYTTGQFFTWTPTNANTTAATLNVDTLGTKSIVKANGGALIANDLITSAMAVGFYDGTNIELLNPQGTAAILATRDFGTSFGDTGGSALTSGSVVYFTVPYACTIAAWNISVDAGTVTFDIWKIATGTAVPTVSNTITASAKPALASGTALHSTSMSSWTTSVAANDIFGIQLNTVATAKYAELDIQCNQ